MKTQTRRGFLKSSLVGAAGALAFPTILPSEIFGAPSPNSRITVGFIGMGRHARGLVRGFLGQGAQVLAVCDVDTTRREDARRLVNEHSASQGGATSNAGGCAAYNDFLQLLERNDIDAVCIATPDHWHAFMTIAALRSGKDVYCEKPLTHNIHEAIQVMKTAKETGRVVQTGSMQRSSSEFRVACEIVRNGVIGRIEKVECSFGPPPGPCNLPEEQLEPGLDWDRWIGPAQMRPYHSELSPRGIPKSYPNWRMYSEFGGGKVADWGAHHLDIAQWGLGMDESGPVTVLPPAKRGDLNGATLVYANGITVKHANGFGVDFFGSEGRVRVNRGKFVVEREGNTIASCLGRADEETSVEREVQKAQRALLSDARVKLYASRNHIADFLASVASRKQPITHAEIGARSAICCHLLNLAYAHHQPLEWDPEKLAFANGAGNAAWLTRDYRGPWKV